MSTNTAVLLLVFNRLDLAMSSFAAIRAAKPKLLFVAADGPRKNHPLDGPKCEQVRKAVSDIDWDCKLFTKFAYTNIGQAESAVSAIDWAFESVEEAIIIEDDCVVSLDHFAFCDQLLPRFRNDFRVGHINAFNGLNQHVSPYSYYFSNLLFTWGFATWRSRWVLADCRMTFWQHHHAWSDSLNELPCDSMVQDNWKSMALAKYPHAYDHRWQFTHFLNHWLTITPAVNLVENRGFRQDASNRQDANFTLPRNGKMSFPLRHPPCFIPMNSFDNNAIRDVLR